MSLPGPCAPFSLASEGKCSDMKVGRMRYRIELQTFISGQDEDGFVRKEWETWQTRWADIVPVSAKEYFSSDRETTEATYKIYIRYTDGVRDDMRIVHNGRIFDIESVLGDKRSGMLTILAKEVT